VSFLGTLGSWLGTETSKAFNALASFGAHTSQSAGNALFNDVMQIEKGVGLVPKNNNPDLAFDGMLVGARGQVFPAGTPLSQVPAVLPAGGLRNNETLIFVNGATTNLSGEASDMAGAANATGSRVIGIHNATDGKVADYTQTLADIAGVGDDKAVDTIAKTVSTELAAGRGVHLLAHSQGGAETSRALQQVYQGLLQQGLTPAQARSKLSAVKVETFGAADANWPSGPEYVHYVNTADPVATLLGVGLDRGAQQGRAGQGAVIRAFTDTTSPHNFSRTYLKYRQPFPAAAPSQMVA